ncbi:gamma-glutamylcyclotransferase [Rhizobium sp. YIM 134829]|uniref:gamma-glutamylcyclotransferase n=1 Tax=Rhizobium sp. YIM 134829 TaxID=3390453 RepID=UPI00397A6B14
MSDIPMTLPDRPDQNQSRQAASVALDGRGDKPGATLRTRLRRSAAGGEMALTAELVALCHREVPDPGPDLTRTPMQEDDFSALTATLLAELGDAPLWVFAYGSLIWKPEFTSQERRRATAFGWHRAFTMKLDRFRGSEDHPGLMMVLEPGGRCDGVVFRIDGAEREAAIDRLLRREVTSIEYLSSFRWLTTRTDAGRVRALCFWCGTAGHESLHLPPEESAAMLARACGHAGSGAEYLFNTVAHLDAFGIRDRRLWRLQKLVADEIRKLYPTRISAE